MKPVVCIAGPTASGKSALALKLAARHDGVILNADALQVYADLNVLSARPSPEDMASAPHWGFGHIDGTQRYSTGQWVRDIVPQILFVMGQGKLPILVGGTGLYFKALMVGMADIPPVNPDVELSNQDFLEEAGIAALQDKAKLLDPIASGRVLGDDPQRLLRIVNVAESSGRALSDWQAATRPVFPPSCALRAVVQVPRDNLYDRINRRYDHMMSNGGWAEAQALLDRGLSTSLPVMKAIGFRQLIPALMGDQGREEALEIAKRETRRFAKRQMTWFRNQCADWDRLDSDASRFDFIDRAGRLI